MGAKKTKDKIVNDQRFDFAIKVLTHESVYHDKKSANAKSIARAIDFLQNHVCPKAKSERRKSQELKQKTKTISEPVKKEGARFFWLGPPLANGITIFRESKNSMDQLDWYKHFQQRFNATFQQAATTWYYLKKQALVHEKGNGKFELTKITKNMNEPGRYMIDKNGEVTLLRQGVKHSGEWYMMKRIQERDNKKA